VVAHDARAVVFDEGAAADSVMHVERGRILLSVTAPNGDEAICGLLEEGAFLGEDVLGGHAVRRQTARAITATEVLVVAKAQMIQLLYAQRALLDRFLAHLLDRNSRLEADLSDHLLHSAEERLARMLLVLAGCDAPGASHGVLPPVSQEVMARMVGTTRSRVNAFMGRFKKLGAIEEASGELRVRPAFLRLVHSRSRSASQ
jgi:CRP-like cAMP-binding protein